MIIEWWHWMVLGLVLAIAELAVPAFFIIWFGLGALGVGCVLLFAPALSIAAQLLIWSLLSVILVVFWFHYLKPITMTSAGSSTAAVIGEVGLLTSPITPEIRGRARFQKPLLGADSWECYADTPIASGERIRVIAVEGSFIKVEKAS